MKGEVGTAVSLFLEFAEDLEIYSRFSYRIVILIHSEAANLYACIALC